MTRSLPLSFLPVRCRIGCRYRYLRDEQLGSRLRPALATRCFPGYRGSAAPLRALLKDYEMGYMGEVDDFAVRMVDSSHDSE